MISVNNSLTARKCYSSREYFHPLGCIKRFKWIFRKVLVVHCFRCQIAKKLSYCQKVIIILPKIACCTKEHFARHHTSRKMFSFLLCLQSAVRKCFLFLFRVSILQMFINQLFSTSTTVVTILSFENLAKKSKHQNKNRQHVDYDHHGHHWKVFAQAGAAQLSLVPASLPPISSINQVLFNQGASTKSFLK